MTSSLANIVADFEQQFADDPLSADHTLLVTGKEILEQHLQAADLTKEIVHSGERLLFRRGEQAATVDLMSRYLAQPLSVEEQAWARWNLVDHLALLRRSDAAVDAQRSFLEWAWRSLPQERLPWVMKDATQALCWLTIGKAEEWLRIFHQVMASIDCGPGNRSDRFEYLRTAGLILAKLGMSQDSLEIAQRIRSPADEDPRWERSTALRMHSYSLELIVHQEAGNTGELRRVAASLLSLLNQQEGGSAEKSESDSVELRGICHNAAAPLYRARQYDLAIPLFRRAAELGSQSASTYGWLAASLWETTRDRAEVLDLLKLAAARHGGGRAWDRFGKLPEFQDVRMDPEFQAAATGGVAQS